MGASLSNRCVFGPFRFDLRTLELTKFDVKLRLEEKPARLLACLIENRGSLVTREDLRRRLWDADVNLDFEHGLNKTANKLRAVLGDTAAEPRYLETLSRRGYRFIADVKFLSEPAIADNAPSASVESSLGPSVALTAQGHGSELPGPPLMPQAALTGTGRSRVLVASAVIIAAVIGVILLSSSIQAPTRYRALNFRTITHSGTEKTPFSTDGERIYFFESGDGKTFLTQVSTNGGGELQLPATASVLPFQADVRGDQLVYLDGNWHEYLGENKGAQVWIRQLPSGIPWQVPEARCQSASWTHDGQLLCALDGEFSIVDLQGKLVRKLFKFPSPAFRAHFSPDGTRIRFDVLPDNVSIKRAELWEARADGTNPHPLAPALPVSCCGNWSPDGTSYVFEVWNGTRWDIWILAENSAWFSRKAEPIRLTSGPLDTRYPRVSADGKSVFFMGADFRGELSVLDEKSGQLVPYLKGRSITQLSFSPDGQWMTYIAYPEGTSWRSRRDGSDALQLTRPPLLAFAPQFSRDGKRIIFTDIGASSSIYSIAFGGGKPEFLSNSKPACTSEELPPNVSFDYVGWCTPSDTGTALQVTDFASGASYRLPSSDGLLSPIISPDGQFIAAAQIHSHQLMLFRIKTQQWSEVPAHLSEHTSEFVWSRDSQHIYMRGDQHIVRISIRNGHSEEIATLQKSSSFLWWGNWLGISPEGKVLLTRQVGSGDIYAFDLQKD